MNTKQLGQIADVRRLIANGEAKRIRESADVSLSEIAQVCDVDNSTVSRWESGRRRPRGEFALRYGRALSLLSNRLSR